tara:strand:- start:28526 stop:29047 length:522 start_codon:yes stop_codon:yes gene_type:complete
MPKYTKATAEERFRLLFMGLHDVCEDQGWGDPCSYNRLREIHTAIELKHKIAQHYSGSDAEDDIGEAEYKSTIGKTINATYNGISVKGSWRAQDKYLREEKLLKYKNHYFVRYDGAEIAEIWRMSGEDVYNYLKPRLKVKYDKLKTAEKLPADPRLGDSICMSAIKKYGEKLK